MFSHSEGLTTMPTVNRNDDLSDSAQIAVYCERLEELDGMKPEEPFFTVVDIEIEAELMRELITKNSEIVRALITEDTLHPGVVRVLSRYFGVFNEECEASFWRLTGCTLN